MVIPITAIHFAFANNCDPMQYIKSKFEPVNLVQTGMNKMEKVKKNTCETSTDEATQGRRTTAAARVMNADGTEETLISSSRRRLDPVQRALLKPGEVEAIGEGHAEVTIINQATKNGQIVKDIAASRPICPNCAGAIEEVGANPVSPLKKVGR